MAKTRKPPPPDFDALVEALTEAQASGRPEGVTTAQELRRRTGWGEERVRKMLRRLAGEGRLRVVRIFVPDICGRPVRVPAYAVKRKA